jgi:hypothetical protein
MRRVFVLGLAMPTCDITEYFHLAADSDGDAVPSGLEPCHRNQQLTPGASSVVSEPLNENTRFIRIHTDSVIRVKISAGDAADQTCMRLGAGQTEFLGVRPGRLTVSIIAST